MTHEAKQLVEELHDQIYNEGYDDGLNDAWECVKKIEAMDDWEALQRMFGDSRTSEILETHTPFEAIAKIKEYEKEHPRIIDNAIRVGDEVFMMGMRGIVIGIKDTEYEVATKLGVGFVLRSFLEKTGTHYAAIADILGTLKENKE